MEKKKKIKIIVISRCFLFRKTFLKICRNPQPQHSGEIDGNLLKQIKLMTSFLYIFLWTRGHDNDVDDRIVRRFSLQLHDACDAEYVAYIARSKVITSRLNMYIAAECGEMSNTFHSERHEDVK